MKISIITMHYVSILFLVLILGTGTKTVFAQESVSVLYVPLIGITSVPEPLALPQGPGNVTYHYAVKNFLSELALTDIDVVDDTCSPIKFVEGDDNNDSKLDYSETWRYTCTVKLSRTTQSTATVTGAANNITANHRAYVTVVVGSDNPAPLVSIVNITKVASPLSLPIEGGDIAFTYRVNNPGVVPLSDVTVTDDKCTNMSGKLGDTNGNNLLDVNEVWTYTCSTHLTQTTTNTVTVTAFANGLKAVGDATITVMVDIPSIAKTPNLPDTGESPNIKITIWGIMAGSLLGLAMFFVLTERNKFWNIRKHINHTESDKKQ